MNELLTATSTGLAAFSATNIDDLVILTLLFSQVNAAFRCRHIFAGQYLGFIALVAASLPGFFGGLILPSEWIGMLGVVPIAIGVNSWLNPEADESEAETEKEPSANSLLTSFLSPQTCSVAAITIANGSDNISIYVPLFASSNWENLGVILSIFFLLVGVWCCMAYKLTQVPAIANTLARYGNNLVPFVLIGLGVSILVESNTLTSSLLIILTVMAGCFCLVIFNWKSLKLNTIN